MKHYLILIMVLFALSACNAMPEAASESSVQVDPVDTVDNTAVSDDMADTDMADTDMADTDMAEPEETPIEEVAADTPSSEAVAYNGPDWANLELVNARTGETFTLADYAGKTVYVEPMATWCSNCRSQLRTVREVVPQLDSDQYVFIGLSVESGLADSTLASYVDEQGFDWPFAVASDALLQALVDEFGRSVTTPPSTPHFLIRPDGSYTELHTGFSSADEVMTMAQAANSGS
ncbi:TlpA family protein disulfide reductase [Phototrophicus methaneseepsis]|uniref:TlpA family protein disulfide reductase n=1 Tax=Phototrophicus methaneseepsis TaxID=2710758 RepID=A0A7S8IFG4_9CHLR|nr:TlpA disulfide reductase family protein [Phototrophicus methaneseepsis]QPC83562.1 TlpA family protein disulfide reductase [Phototrophicus methaneseepsis]